MATAGVPALERRRIGHVGRTYLRAENYTAANPYLITKQADIGFAQALGGELVAAIDLFFGSGTASLPEVLITDTGSYSDLVFGIAQLLGVDYRTVLADLPDQKGWRADSGADYGSLNTFARENSIWAKYSGTGVRSCA